jgi:hypothetical protein
MENINLSSKKFLSVCSKVKMGEPGGGGEERWEKIGIAPHQQTLNLYYFNKYINFVIKLLSIESTFDFPYQSHIVEKEKEDKRWRFEHKKSLYVSFLIVFCPTCCNISSDLNKFFTFNDAVEYAEEQSYLTKTF